MAYFTKTEQTILTFLWKHKGHWTAKGILRWESSSWRKLTSWLQTLLQIYSNQTVQRWHKRRLKGKRNRIDSPGINPQIGDQWIYDRVAKDIHQGKDSPLNKLPGKRNITSQRRTLNTICTTHKTNENLQLSTSKPSFTGSSEDGHPAVSNTSSQQHTGDFSLLFTQNFPTQWNLPAGPEENELLSVWVRPSAVLKPSTWRVLRRPSSCQLCTEPGLWAEQAGPALVSQAGLSPSAEKVAKCRLHPLSSVETQYPAQHPTESTKVWKYRWMEANISWLLKKSRRTIRNHTQWNECRHKLYNLHPKSLKIVHRHIYNIKL